jgi:L-ascorbate metabolism protein UlaG (beta-lactamase superfamily)
VKFFAATHGGGILKTKRYCSPAGLLITYKWKKVYHAGDTSLMMDMQMLARYNVDVACLPIDWLYNMDIADAATAVSYIKPKIVFPIHFDTWPKIRVDAVEFARQVMADGIAVPKVLTPWQYIALD